MSNNQDTVLKVLIKQTMLPIEQFWRKKLRKKDWIKIEQSRGVEQTKNKQQLNFAASAKASSSEKRPERDFCTVPDYHVGEAGYCVAGISGPEIVNPRNWQEQ